MPLAVGWLVLLFVAGWLVWHSVEEPETPEEWVERLLAAETLYRPLQRVQRRWDLVDEISTLLISRLRGDAALASDARANALLLLTRWRHRLSYWQQEWLYQYAAAVVYNPDENGRLRTEAAATLQSLPCEQFKQHLFRIAADDIGLSYDAVYWTLCRGLVCSGDPDVFRAELMEVGSPRVRRMLHSLAR